MTIPGIDAGQTARADLNLSPIKGVALTDSRATLGDTQHPPSPPTNPQNPATQRSKPLLINNLSNDIYHAWLRQQLGVTSIKPGDFESCRIYFDHRIQRILDHPDPDVTTAYQTFVNAAASAVAHHMDGTYLNQHRQTAGKTYRSAITREYIKFREQQGLPEVHFVYHPYAGPGTPDGDWTIGYNNITLAGYFTAHLSEESRQQELHNPDNGERWPENEISPVDTPTALYHLLRQWQFLNRPPTSEPECGREDCEHSNTRCEHAIRIQAICQQEYRNFQQWRQDRLRANPEVQP